MENKNHRKNRKFLLGLLALVFINSALTLKLRGYQRSKNLKILKSELKNRHSESIFDKIEKTSKEEDLWLLIGTNMVTLILVAGFDRFETFEENGKAFKKEIIRTEI